MQNFGWCHILGTVFVLWIQMCGCVRNDQPSSKSLSKTTHKTGSSITETIELLNTQSATQGTNFDVSNTENLMLNSQHSKSSGERQTRQTFPAAENSQSLVAELTRQKSTKSGNSLHRLFSDKINTEDVSRRGGRGQSRPSLTSSDRLVQEQRPREEFCCIRRPYIVSAGYDAFGKESLVDVGKCRRVAKSIVAHLSLLGADPASRTELLDRIANSQTQCGTCNGGDSCVATQSRIERLNLHGGLKEVLVAEDCSCIPKPPQCGRISQHQTFFPDSPYETVVDVGMCSGHCKSQGDSQTHCRPTKNRTVTVEGPMGHHCVDVIESCECTGECYRASYVESYYSLEWNATLNRTQQVVKEIDVGRCAGGCDSSRSLKCLMGSGHTPSSCLMGLYGQTSCSARSYTNHAFTLRNGKRTSVLSIDSCQCQ